MAEEFYDDDIQSVDLNEVSKKYMSLYGMNIILQRAIPMLTDGLKPIHRRIIWAIKRASNGSPMKVAEIQGDTMKFSPHSELGTRFIVAGLAQPFANNVPLLASSSGYGTPTCGDDVAAARYWSAGISKFAMEVFFSEFDPNVNMKDNYDGKYKEPITFPAKFPTILLNGSHGIAYSMSSDILPYNINEVADATIKLLKNPDAKVHLIPDSPTWCDVIKRDDTTFVFQSSYDVDNINYKIIIMNTPPGEYLQDIDKKLREIQDSPNPIKEIISADNESDLAEGVFKYVIRCKPCNLYQVINTLFRRVPGFRITVSTRNCSVVDASLQTRYYNERQILLSWIKNRLTEKRAWFLRKLVDASTEYNMLEGKRFMLSPENLQKTIKAFRGCEEESEIIQKLVDTYKGKVTTSQANYVSGMKLAKLTNGEYKRTVERMDVVSEEIKRLKTIVNDPDCIRDEIINDIKNIRTNFGHPRRSKILNNQNGDNVNIGICQILTDGTVVFSETENPNHFASDVTPIDGDEVCLIDQYGKSLWVNVNQVPHDKPITLTSIGKEPMSACIAVVPRSSRSIVMLSNKGRIKLMPIEKIPSNQSRKALIPLNDDEHLVTILNVDQSSEDLLVYTSDGYGKRFSVADLNSVNSPDAQGQFIVKGYDVAGVFAISSSKPYIFYATRLGRVRLNNARFLVSGKKFGGLKPIIKLSPQDDLVSVFCADKDQSVTLYHADGRASTVNIDSLAVVTMNTPPAKPKHVPAVKVIRATLS
jgi:DNA gyrase subunit A